MKNKLQKLNCWFKAIKVICKKMTSVLSMAAFFAGYLDLSVATANLELVISGLSALVFIFSFRSKLNRLQLRSRKLLVVIVCVAGLLKPRQIFANAIVTDRKRIRLISCYSVGYENK